MYETFFGLKRRPFLFAPDMDAYLPTDFMEESRRTVEQTVQQGQGMSLIFGATGKGKTLLLRLLCQSLESEYAVAFVSHSHLETPKALFLQLTHDLRLATTGSDPVELRLQLLDFARQEPAVVLLFDDAQHLSPAVLEEIRLLTDATEGSIPLFRAVFAGTMDFEEKLTLPNLEAFNQRVASRCYLESFSGRETSQYIVRQTDELRIDPPHSSSAAPLFTEEAKRRIYQLTDGIPRIINQLCTAALQLAAERSAKNVDGSLINGAWAGLQHMVETESPAAGSPAASETTITQEQIEEIIDQKRKTFQFRQFNSVEFGALTDVESELSEPTSRSTADTDYKPPYPEEDDEFAETASRETDRNDLSFHRLQLHVPADAEETADRRRQFAADASGEAFPSESAAVCHLPSAFSSHGEKTPQENPSDSVLSIAVPKLVLNFHKRHRKFQRKRLLQQIQHRLGLFAGLLSTAQVQTILNIHESDMNAQSLQAYGAAVLDGRPPFVRKEPQYAYQTSKTSPRVDVTYPDPQTGVPITLRWLPETTQEEGRFGVSYTEFLSREMSEKLAIPHHPEPITSPVVRTSLHASRGVPATLSYSPGLDETFEETEQVGDAAVSLAELFRVNSSALQQLEDSAEFKFLDKALQHQLEAVVKRITKAAEKIEQAAEVSERAGQHVTKAAEFVETEVKSALPTYLELFKELSDFQKMVSAELEAARQQSAEQPQFRTFPRRQVMIERTVQTIGVESLLR